MKKKTKILLMVLGVLILSTSIFFLVKNNNKKTDTTKIKLVTNNKKKYGDVKGLLWKVEKGDSKVYMLGSIHVGTPDLYPMHQSVEEAFEKSDALVVEAEIGKTKSSQPASSSVYYDKNDNLFNHISEEAKANLKKVCKELGEDINNYGHYKSWLVAHNIHFLQLQKSGYLTAYGVDNHFLIKAKGKKEIVEVEGKKYKVDMHKKFSNPEEEIMNIPSLSEIKENIESLIEAYKVGDEKKISEYVSPISDSPTKSQQLHTERNTHMTKAIEEYLDSGKTYFVVVGSFHYVGEKGIVQQLIDNGYNVERVE